MNPFALLIDYRLTDRAVQVRTIGDLLLAEYPLDEVTAVHHGIRLFRRHRLWLNRLDLWETAVTLRRADKPDLVLTPAQPEQFVSTVRSLLRRRRDG